MRINHVGGVYFIDDKSEMLDLLDKSGLDYFVHFPMRNTVTHVKTTKKEVRDVVDTYADNDEFTMVWHKEVDEVHLSSYM